MREQCKMSYNQAVTGTQNSNTKRDIHPIQTYVRPAETRNTTIVQQTEKDKCKQINKKYKWG